MKLNPKMQLLKCTLAWIPHIGQMIPRTSLSHNDIHKMRIRSGSALLCFALLCFAFAYVIYVFCTATQYRTRNEHWTVFALMRFDDIIPNPIFKYTKTMKCIASRIRNRQWLIYFMERQKWQLKVEYMYIVCVKRARECMYVAKKKRKREKTHGKQPPICINVNNCI